MKTADSRFLASSCFLSLLLVAFFAARVSSASLDCPPDSVCIFSGVPTELLAKLEQKPDAAESETTNEPLTVRDLTALMKDAKKTDSTVLEGKLATGNWCKGLENDNIRQYEIASGQLMMSWEEVIMMVSKKTGVKPEYLCTLLWMESRGDAYDRGDDGECGAFQTMPQYYQNYEDYCSDYGSSYAFVGKTCDRKKWGNYPFNAYPKAELGYDDPSSCFHPLNSATAGAIEIAAKLKEAGGDVRGGFRRYNGSGRDAEIYADKAFSRLQKVYDALVA
ncbi:MAG: hypothetical protein V1817_04235 [Candidatus Micrarchaeota archaeon]